MKNPTTPRSIGLNRSLGIDNTFAEIRAKAKDDEISRHKGKKNKKKGHDTPYKVGQELVCLAPSIHGGRAYVAIEILDIDISKETRRRIRWSRPGSYFVIYAVIRKVSHADMAHKIGRITHLAPSLFGRPLLRLEDVNVPVDSIKWIEEKSDD